MDLTGQWPDPTSGDPATVALVCRSNTAGLDAAGRLLHQWAASAVLGLHVVAVVVVADAPSRPSRAVRERVGDLKAVVGDVFTMPWVNEWRDNPYTSNEDAAAIGQQIVELTTRQENR